MDKKNLTIEETFALAVQNQQKNNLQVAENLYKEILKTNPNHFQSNFLLGTLSAQTKKFDIAKQLLQKAIHIQPNYADAHNNLGNVQRELDEHQKAKVCFEKAIQINPNYAQAHNNLGIVFKELEELQKAISSFQKAIQINPNDAQVHNNLGIVFKELGEYQKAISSYQKAIQINPNDAQVHNNLGIMFNESKELQKAISCFQKAIQIQPNYADAHNNLGSVLQKLGEPQKAVDCFQKAIQIQPNHISAHNNMLFTLLYFEKIDPKYLLSKSKEFRSSLKPIKDDLLLKYQFNSKPKKLKIGFVSGDFKQHPIGFVLLNTLKHLKNKNLELIAYSNSLKKDSLSIELKSHFASWHEIEKQKDLKIINQIRKDGIHILFDLSGHSGKNRLPIFINKPAPIQVSWAGYNGSTGIPEIDYFIGDPIVTPASESNYYVEKIFPLPNIWQCYTAPDIEIKLDQLPVIKNGYITFGCFNNLSKINNEVISLWSRILKSIPKSKIFLKTKELNYPYLKKKIINNFQKNNVNLDSLILEGSFLRKEILTSYNKIDIALDPFPYSGNSTSFEAIWMGVPVLTKKGSSFVSHSTESVNHNCGMSDWIASDKNEYVKKAIKFSTNIEWLSEINKNLRRTALESPLFNSSLFAKQLDNALWKMWNNFILKN